VVRVNNVTNALQLSFQGSPWRKWLSRRETGQEVASVSLRHMPRRSIDNFLNFVRYNVMILTNTVEPDCHDVMRAKQARATLAVE